MIAQEQVTLLKSLSNFCKQYRNICGPTCHGPHAMFRKYTKKHNKGTYVGFIKPSECQMGGELISLLCLFCLKKALRLTINSNKFLNLNTFKEECFVLNNDNFWLYLFLMCGVLYALMHLLHLANLQSAAMDKLHFYVLQTDRMMVRWLPDCKQKSKELLKDISLRQVISTCDIDVDRANNEEIADADNDDDKEGGDDSLNNDDLDLDIDDEEEDEEKDDAFDFLSQSKYLLCALLIVNYCTPSCLFLFPKLPGY
jgi:hypothetical protein